MSAPMSPDRWKRLSELFERALETPESDVAAFIERECAGDADLADQLRSLLAVQPGAEKFLDNPGDLLSPMLATPGAEDSDGFGESLVGRRLAGYRLIRQVGEGGMGVVYLAEQLSPRRTVALKVIRASLATPGALRRFEHEAHILARLQHPGIAQIYEAGAADEATGVRGFFAMEYVRGRPLTEFAASERLGVKEKAALIARVADTIQHAHQKGVIHRDLKPTNVLVTEQGEPKVLDFGVARAMDSDIHLTTVRTSVGQMIGTLPYMSPEQVAGDPTDVDTRSDIYALGVMLYELLTGRLPLEVKSRPIPEAARIIRDEEPTRLSVIDRTLRGDIETIVLKALDKNKAGRYQTSAEFAADLRRFIAGEPIAARRDSAMYVLRKQLRRYRGVAAAAAVFVLALAAFAGVALAQSRANRRLAAAESEAKQEAIAAREVAESERRRADAESERLRRELYFGRIGYAEAALAQGDVARVRRLLQECPEDLRGWEWGFLANSSEQSDRWITARERGWGGGAFGSRSPVFITFRIGEETVIRDVRSGDVRFRIAPPGGVMDVSLSPDGRWAVMFGQKGEVYLQDLEGEARERAAPWKTYERQPMSARFDEDGSRIALVDPAGDLTLIDRETGEERPLLAGRALAVAAIAGDGAVVAGGFDGAVVLVMGDSAVDLGRHDDMVRDVAIDPTGRLAATAGNDGAVRVWDLESRTMRWVSRPFKNKAAAVAWSSDGSTIYTGGTETRLEALDARTGESMWRGLGHTSTILDICGHSSGEALTTGIDGEVRWWTAESAARAERIVPLTGQNLLRAAVVPDGFLAMDWEGAVLHLGVDGRSRVVRGPTGKTGFALASTTGGYVAAEGQDHVTGYVWPLGQERWRTPEGLGKVVTTTTSPDGAYVAMTLAEGPLLVLSARDGSVLAQVEGHPEGAHMAAWRPDGREIYTTGVYGLLRVWTWSAEGKTLALSRERTLSSFGVWTISVSPDGRKILVGGDESEAWLLDADSLEGVRLVGHQGAVYASCFSPDGSRAVTGGFDNTTRIWETATGAEVVVLRTHRFSVHAIEFDPTGRTMLTLGGDGLAVLRRGGPAPPDQDRGATAGIR